MAGFNEIQVGRFNRFVQKLLAVKGAPPMATLASDLQFTHPSSPGTGAELRYLQGWDFFGFALGVQGAAGQVSAVELRNPKSSNVCCVIERMMFGSVSGADVAQGIQYRGATLDQPTIGVVKNFDARGRAQSSTIASQNGGGNLTAVDGVSNAFINAWQPITTFVDLLRAGDEIPLLPGDAIVLQNSVAANNCRLGFFWRERFLEDSERS